MKTIKIIDLLIKIANEEELPKKIKYKGYIFEYDTNHERYEAYIDEEMYTLNVYVDINEDLTCEVEIIEDGNKIEKIERLKYSTNFNKEEFMLYQNILAVNGNVNDLIDKVNELEKRYEKKDK